jgi:hypothetical protein
MRGLAVGSFDNRVVATAIGMPGIDPDLSF